MALKFMTWNVENLFRPQNGSTDQGYDQKLDLLANVILGQKPDVLALQEVGGEDPLWDLQQKLGVTYAHSKSSVFPDGRGIRVAFLSKHAIDEWEDIVDFPPGPALDVQELDGSGNAVPITRMGRGALRVRVKIDGLTVDLITAHLKSKLLTFKRPGGSSFTSRDEGERAQVAGVALLRRTAEAVTLRIRSNALLIGDNPVPLILLGDFNDVPEAQTSLILCGPPGSEIGTTGFDRPDKGDDVRLFNLSYVIKDSEQRYSRKHRGQKEMLDQIFVSENLLPKDPNKKRILPEVQSITDFAEQLPSIGENPGERVDEVAPDHAPVMATFSL